MKKVGLLLLLTAIVLSLTTRSSFALKEFKTPFDERYVKDSDNEEFQAAYKKESCNVCHVKGEKKDVVNAYGMELAQLIPGNTKQRLDNAKDVSSEAKEAEETKILEELQVAFEKVEGIKSPAGATYGEMLGAHELPAGEPVGSVKEEPIAVN